MIRKPKETPREPELNARDAVAAILGDRDTLVVNIDTHLDKLRQMGYSEEQIEDFRLKLNIGDGEPS